MRISWTETQLARLKELESDVKDLGRGFGTEQDRDQAFQILEKDLVRSARQKLDELRAGSQRSTVQSPSSLTKVP